MSVGNRAVKPWPPGPAVGKVEVAKTGGVIRRRSCQNSRKLGNPATHWLVVVIVLNRPDEQANSFGGEVDTVLGVSMAPTAVRMVLVEGENADGVTVDEEGFDVNSADAPTVNAADQVVSAILGTQEGAAESGYQLRSTGVTWTDPVEAAALRDALAARKVENVMLVSSFLAAAALAQVVGSSVGYAQTGLLFVEPDTATLAVVNTADGSITEVHRQPLTPGSDPVAELAALASGAEALETRPDGLFLVGSGVDIAPLKPQLEAATALIVSAPEEPETALARGAALASANAPLFSSSTAALAYAQDPGTGAIDPYAVAPGYFDVAVDSASGEQALAYSAVADEDADAYTAFADEARFETGTYTGVSDDPHGRRPSGRCSWWPARSRRSSWWAPRRCWSRWRSACGQRPPSGPNRATRRSRPSRRPPRPQLPLRRRLLPARLRLLRLPNRRRRPRLRLLLLRLPNRRRRLPAPVCRAGPGARGSGSRAGCAGSRAGCAGSRSGCSRARCSGSCPAPIPVPLPIWWPRWARRSDHGAVPVAAAGGRGGGVPRRRRLPGGGGYPGGGHGGRRPRRLRRPRGFGGFGRGGFGSAARVSKSDGKLSPDVCLPLRRAMPLAHCGDLHTGV